MADIVIEAGKGNLPLTIADSYHSDTADRPSLLENNGSSIPTTDVLSSSIEDKVSISPMARGLASGKILLLTDSCLSYHNQSNPDTIANPFLRLYEQSYRLPLSATDLSDVAGTATDRRFLSVSRPSP